MSALKLRGLDGSHLFGFLATYGLLRLLHSASLRGHELQPRLCFDKHDYCAVLEGVSSTKLLVDAVHEELVEFHRRLDSDFASIVKPKDLTQLLVDTVAKSNDALALDELAGLGCVIAGESHETTLCAANGAGHQNMVLSMRDVLLLLAEYPDALEAAINRPWTYEFEPTSADRAKFGLKNRKPTIRLDPSDERLYALRLDNPTSTTAKYKTELGAQALAAAAFGGLPVIPRGSNPVTLGSERRGARTFFYWGLWNIPVSYSTVRSLLATGIHNIGASRARGVFAAFRAARVTGAKGKLSFAPTEPWW